MVDLDPDRMTEAYSTLVVSRRSNRGELCPSYTRCHSYFFLKVTGGYRMHVSFLLFSRHKALTRT